MGACSASTLIITAPHCNPSGKTGQEGDVADRGARILQFKLGANASLEQWLHIQGEGTLNNAAGSQSAESRPPVKAATAPPQATPAEIVAN